jgi:hypothetical protein
MKQLKMGFLALVLFMAACQKNTTTSKETELESTESTPIAQRCASQEVLEQQMAADPGLRQRREAIEAHTQQVLSNRSHHRLMNDGTIEIPVVVHVIYRTADENISTAQVESQIAVLNEDFTNTNLDSTKANSSRFGDFNTNVGIRFTLKEIIRIPSSKRSWSTNDDMKFTSKGGSNTVDPQNNLNMWVVNKMTSYGSTILGYAQFPGGAWATDGVVIAHNYFGRIGKVSAPYHLGRTATHEVGHWINLRHIWGDATCGNDLVEDTPQHNTSNGGCPSSEHKSTCTGTPYEMWMNYMDYTYDECMYMFTHKQKDRMRAVFASGAFRAAMAQ